MEDPEMEKLEGLIRNCIESGRIEGCVREEEGQYSITVVEMTYWPRSGSGSPPSGAVIARGVAR